jgi:hypothetical protein
MGGATGVVNSGRGFGWSGPEFQETANTPNLLAAEGIRYVVRLGQ